MDHLADIVESIWEKRKADARSIGQLKSYVKLSPSDLDALGIIPFSEKVLDADVEYGIIYSGVEPELCSLLKVPRKQRRRVRVHTPFKNRCVSYSFPSLPLKVFGYHGIILFVEPIVYSAMTWATDVVANTKYDIWGEENRCRCSLSTKTTICKFCRNSEGVEKVTLGSRQIFGKSVLRAILAFLMMYAYLGEDHPHLLDSVFITAGGEVRILLLDELEQKESPRNVRQLCFFLSAITGGSDLGDIGKLDSEEVVVPVNLRSDDYIPLALKNYYLFLLTYNHREHYAAFCFDPPFLHQWADRSHYAYSMYVLINCYNNTLQEPFKSVFHKYIPQAMQTWIDEMKTDGGIVGDYNAFRNEMFRLLSKGDDQRLYRAPAQENALHFYVNLLKHIFESIGYIQVDHDNARKLTKQLLDLWEKGGAGASNIDKSFFDRESEPLAPKEVVLAVEKVVDFAGLVFQTEIGLLHSLHSDEKVVDLAKTISKLVRTWNILGFRH